ncbi:MAG: hypothetical protein WA821_17295 [Anaerolineales bacterium]
MKKKPFIFALMAVMFLMVMGCAPGAMGVQINTPVPGAKTTPAPNGQINLPGVSLQIYTPGQNPLINTPDARGSVAGVWLGVWHGVISPVTLALSFANKDVQMYEVHNDGSQYNLGFFLGIVVLLVVLGALVGSRRR